MSIAYIALGANLGQPGKQVLTALAAIAQIPGIHLLTQSPLYRTAPLGPADQPYYCNAVCKVETVLSPEALLQQLLTLERAVGRVRGEEHWGPRLLDLDVLHVEGERRDTLQLKLPHPGIAQRNFVLIPLADIAADLLIPDLGRVDELAKKIGRDGLELWPE